MFYVCREMGWDYWTYMRQPMFFVKIVTDMLAREARQTKKITPHG